eukprot:TRINITY_DN3409_c0_g1_i1.p1 TRINITY_DN3409_c0_g1~~TRINITY_DN3409_c0_g1_i1.p1  ORF type:complete len:500 (-),score=121.85 TRINITY_DN3409_c0_g1_i1:40-1539(-)
MQRVVDEIGKMWNVEEHSLIFEEDLHLLNETNLFMEDFYPNAPLIFINQNKEDVAVGLIAVSPVPFVQFPDVLDDFDFAGSYNCLLIRPDGSYPFSLQNIHAKKIHTRLETYFNRHKTDKNGDIYFVYDQEEISEAVADLETNHTTSVHQIKVAVIYALPGQLTMEEIFSNQPPPESQFWEFLGTFSNRIDMQGFQGYRGDMGTSGDDVKNDSYYINWKEREFMFHVAPLMNSEQHRRLIGNDMAVIIYYEGTEPFNPEPLNGIGGVPQVFSVIQPVENMYRCGFFSRGNIKPYLPAAAPLDHLFSPETLKDYLLTKIHNGTVTTKSCPPMSKLFSRPKQFAIKEIGEQFPKQNRLSRRASKRFSPEIAGISLCVSVLQGKSLRAMDPNGKSDPYCIVKLGEQSKKTRVKKKTLNPVWNSELSIVVPNEIPESTTIDFVCYDWDRVGSDDYLGELHITVAEMRENCGVTKWYELEGKKGKKPGKNYGQLQINFNLDMDA